MRLFASLLLLGACQTVEEEPFPCEDYPVVTWDSFAHGFVTQHCQACHASGSADRNDAPVAVNFDDLDLTLEYADRILVVATGDDPVMPPVGGVDEDDRLRLEIWLECYAE